MRTARSSAGSRLFTIDGLHTLYRHGEITAVDVIQTVYETIHRAARPDVWINLQASAGGPGGRADIDGECKEQIATLRYSVCGEGQHRCRRFAHDGRMSELCLQSG